MFRGEGSVCIACLGFWADGFLQGRCEVPCLQLYCCIAVVIAHLLYCLYRPVEALQALMTYCMFLRAFARICGGCDQLIRLHVSLNPDMRFHF